MVIYGQDITSKILNGFQRLQIFHCSVYLLRFGMTIQEVVDLLSDEYGWSDSVSNLSAKLQRESIRYKEVLELADVLGCDIVWQQRREK